MTCSQQRISDGLPLVEANAPEPPVGTGLAVGAPIGLGDGLRFVHVDSSPTGWHEIVNGGRATRVPWERVAYWAPLRRSW